MNLQETMGGCGRHINGLQTYCGHDAIRHNNVNKLLNTNKLEMNKPVLCSFIYYIIVMKSVPFSSSIGS